MSDTALVEGGVGQPWPRRTVVPRAALLLGAIVAGDFLLFDQPTGIGWFVFVVLLALAIVAAGRARFDTRSLIGKAILPALALLPLIENVSPLSVAVALIGLAIFALSLPSRLRTGLARIGRQLVGFFVAAPFRLAADTIRWRSIRQRLGRRGKVLAGLLGWIMALVLGAVFIGLFGIANPVIENWLNRIDIFALLKDVDVARFLFWIVIACGSWAYLRPRLPRWHRAERTIVAIQQAQPAASPSRQATLDALFGRAALLRALVVFNAIFAVQTILDAAYLWGGVALPDGMSYASYAHRGAYPLIVTALLAAGFVLASLRPGSATSSDRLIRGLVYLWVGQNVWLVLSSILRLDLYVNAYSLTYWRIADFLWMVLVAAGLLTIIARIALAKSNEWLLSANLLTLSALTYACCFINFAAIIADYNVDHAKEMRGEGMPIDSVYLRNLGPAAFPAIDRLRAAFPNERFCGYDADYDGDSCLDNDRLHDESAFHQTAQNWRSWSFRNWRLMRYLDSRAAVTSPSAGSAN
ncbi:MAG: DUF4173 domain-containing protein [Rhizobiaceae bacterium]